MPTPRNETLRDQIATAIQAGHRDRKTSDEISGDVLAFIEAQPVEPSPLVWDAEQHRYAVQPLKESR